MSRGAQRLPPRVRDLHLRDLSAAAPGNHALDMRGRESGAHKLDQVLDGEAVREHDRLAAAVRAGGEQFERAPTIGLGAASAAWSSWHPPTFLAKGQLEF
jgi:hypothetical protein